MLAAGVSINSKKQRVEVDDYAIFLLALSHSVDKHENILRKWRYQHTKPTWNHSWHERFLRFFSSSFLLWLTPLLSEQTQTSVYNRSKAISKRKKINLDFIITLLSLFTCYICERLFSSSFVYFMDFSYCSKMIQNIARSRDEFFILLVNYECELECEHWRLNQKHHQPKVNERSWDFPTLRLFQTSLQLRDHSQLMENMNFHFLAFFSLILLINASRLICTSSMISEFFSCREQSQTPFYDIQEHETFHDLCKLWNILCFFFVYVVQQMRKQ